MSDLISRGTVLRCIMESREGIDWGQSDDEDAFLHCTGALYRTIASNECIPAVDAVPVVHAKWIDIPDRPEWFQKMCSACGDYFCCQNNYCSNCGAKMDREWRSRHEDDPAIDTVPVVRCRDCAHAQKTESNERFDCLLLDCNNPESFYCMFGERRDSDGKDA